MVIHNGAIYKIVMISIALAIHYPVVAHPGKINVEGCHTSRKTGEYHCHHSRSFESPSYNTKVSRSKLALIEPTAPFDRVLKLEYQGFTIWLDCAKRGAIKFQYNAQHDTGSFKRYSDFFLDPNVPAECQQTSTKAYGRDYDRGHQVSANHLDYSDLAIQQSNYMTNVLPQTSQMNRGAWERTEEIIECYRDIDELLVIGGVIWGENPADDYFLHSHGVKTPDAYWKVVIRGLGSNERVIAWVVPNSNDATKKNLDNYLVSVDELERLVGEKIPIAEYAKHEKPNASWLIPLGCNKG